MDKYNINKPIWVTETEFTSGTDVIAAAKGAFDAGAEKVFFTSFIPGKLEPAKQEQFSYYENITDLC